MNYTQKYCVRAVQYACGLCKKAAIKVYCYHGILENRKDPRLERNFTLVKDFRAQVDYLRQFEVLSLEELLHELPTSPKRGKTACAITFDDGYANNLQAAEILAAARLPWSVFISTGAVGRDNAIWTVELSLLLLQGQAEKVEVLDRVWPLTSRRDREASFQGIRYPLKAMPADLRQETMAVIRAQFPQDAPRRLLHEFPSLQMLTWEEVEQLAQAGVEIGSHGVNHEIHHANQVEAVRRHELQASKSEIERRLERPCRYFAFPNGDFNSASAVEVRAAGYELGFTLKPRTIQSGDNPCLIPRFAPTTVLHKFVGGFLGGLILGTMSGPWQEKG